ncbi:putative cytochrome c oxidase assembly protein [Botrytis fragariae]|uniref:Putative cytochrome c oxidase assembly protein n=1 Tax=Botrytis fragariae TaxID=1964551 RepID=A0A8H6AM84_9HELO|nr:putative cytochrome c oxidase assembly protein [Botrytis fragariae]KAF5870157.1 putative cytochrome c oxidase assembly protein [Botrytis fragariae]
MSTFGSPGGRMVNNKPSPPERGSFPLDHDGECKSVMQSYLNCMKKVRGMNDPECRDLAKSYLSCRMDRNLMAKDEFKNLGFADESSETKGAEQKDDAKEGGDNANKHKNELRW